MPRIASPLHRERTRDREDLSSVVKMGATGWARLVSNQPPLACEVGRPRCVRRVGAHRLRGRAGAPCQHDQARVRSIGEGNPRCRRDSRQEAATTSL